MRVLIVEDEQLAIEKLSRTIHEVDKTIEIVGQTDGIETTVQWLRANQEPDLIFLDIELSDGQSFEIFNQTVVNSAVIFTTSYDEYAIQAFKVNSIDYLLKPIKKDDLRQSLEKYARMKQQYGHPAAPDIQQLLKDIRGQLAPEYRDRFLVKHGLRMLPIDIVEIAYFYSENSITFLKTKGNVRFILEYSLDELEAMVDPRSFFRANRSFIIHIKSVDAVYPHLNGRLKTDLKPTSETEVLISREKAQEFKDWLGR
ncbi:MAG: response regulator transcription factor [Saprospiraceae bacterium]|nr:response regulator transcription factor [Saprospiraceae bacterium]